MKQTLPKVGQIWEVWGAGEYYPAVVLAVGKERVKIKRVHLPGITATATFAKLEMFTGVNPRYMHIVEARL